MREGEHAIRATDLVPQRVRFSLDQHLPGIVFLLDDRLDDFAEAAHDLVFFFAERGLV